MLDGQQAKLNIYQAKRKAGTHEYIDANTNEHVEKDSFDKSVMFLAMNKDEAKELLETTYEGEWVIFAEHKRK